MKYKAQLSEAFAKMEDEFTSREFTHELRSLGVPNKFINDGNCHTFLNQGVTIKVNTLGKRKRFHRQK